MISEDDFIKWLSTTAMVITTIATTYDVYKNHKKKKPNKRKGKSKKQKR